jgi:hypothetical protein
MQFPVSEDMSPEINLLVFYVSNVEVIPDSVTLPVEKCLKNKVYLSKKKEYNLC